MDDNCNYSLLLQGWLIRYDGSSRWNHQPNKINNKQCPLFNYNWLTITTFTVISLTSNHTLCLQCQLNNLILLLLQLLQWLNVQRAVTYKGAITQYSTDPRFVHSVSWHFSGFCLTFCMSNFFWTNVVMSFDIHNMWHIRYNNNSFSYVSDGSYVSHTIL